MPLVSFSVTPRVVDSCKNVLQWQFPQIHTLSLLILSTDVIVTDSSDPVGPASVLFETPFYNAMYKSLREGGIVCTQGECMWLHLDLIKPLMQSISQKFTDVSYAYTTIPTYPRCVR